MGHPELDLSRPLGLPGLPMPEITVEIPEDPETLKLQYEARLGTAATGITKLDEGVVHIVSGQLAGYLHHNWAVGYRANPINRTGDGPDDFKPRWKPIGSAYAWLAVAEQDPELMGNIRVNPETQLHEVDIARVPFGQLPNNPWVIENYTAATQAVTLIHHAVATGAPLNGAFLERSSAQIHSMWAYRHPEITETSDDEGEEAYRATQRLDYDDPEFTEVERNKDREHIVLTAELYAGVVRQLAQQQVPKPELAARINERLDHFLDTAARVGSVLFRRRSDRMPQAVETFTEQEVTAHATTLIDAVVGLVDGWEETSVRLTTEGDVVRSYARNHYLDIGDRDIKPSIVRYIARLRFTGANYEQLCGAGLEYCLGSYTTHFEAGIGSSRSVQNPRISSGVEHPFSTKPLDSHTNDRYALERAERILSRAQRELADA
jgi:hypothetical protein